MADSWLTQEPTFEEFVERPRRGLVGRFFQTVLHSSCRPLLELFELLQRSPLVLNQGLRYMESSFKKQQQGPLTDSIGMIFAVGLLISAAIMAAGNVPWIVWGGLIVIAFGVAIVERIRS